MGGYTVYQFVKLEPLLKGVLVPCILTVFSSLTLLLNLLASILYFAA